MADVLAAAHAALHDERRMDDLLRQLDRHRVRVRQFRQTPSHACSCLRSTLLFPPMLRLPRRANIAWCKATRTCVASRASDAGARLPSVAQAQTLAGQAAADSRGSGGTQQPRASLAAPQASSTVIAHDRAERLGRLSWRRNLVLPPLLPDSNVVNPAPSPLDLLLRHSLSRVGGRWSVRLQYHLLALRRQALDDASASAIAAAALAVNAGDPSAALVDLLRVYLVDIGARVCR